MTKWFLAILTVLAATATDTWGQVPRISLESIGVTFSAPVYLTNARDGSGRRFVVEQGGRILLAGPPSTVFLDIRSKLVSGGERGLLGLAFHPQFSSNRRFFVNYTRQPDGATVIAEYRTLASNPNLGDAASENILLTIPQPYENHNGGMVEFGPDGRLYVGMGDGGSANDPQNRAQNQNVLLGKMLRINVDTRQVDIFASGLRNPWRFSFDRVTGELWAGDVGQNAREEVDIIREGGNYGWRVFEGTACTGLGPASCSSPGFIPPITEYVHGATGRCSITGGYVYRGSRASLPYGAYVFGDYCSGEIFMWKDGVQSLLQNTTLSISSFGEDESGEIFVVGLDGGIFKITNPDVVTATQRDFVLNDQGAVSFTAAPSSSLSVGYARIQSASGGLPGGLAIYSLRSGGVLISETSVPISPLIQSGRTYADVGGSVRTGVAIANPNSQDITISFYFTDANGQDFNQGTAVIPAGQQIARFLDESPFNATGIFRGTFTFSASALVSAVTLRGFTNERSEFLFTSLPVAALAGTTGEAVFPQFADGGGWESEFLLINPTDAPISGILQASTTLSLNGQNGSNFPYTIPSKSSRRFITGGGGNLVQAGFVRVIPAISASAPAGIALFRFRRGGITVSEGGIPVVRGGTALVTYAEVSGAVRSGLAIANTGVTPASVSLTFTPLSGGTPAYTGTISVPAAGQRSLFLNEVQGFTSLPSPLRGVLRITSPVAIGVTALRGRINERGDFLTTGTPPVDESESVLSSELLFPHFVLGDGYETEFVLFSVPSSGQPQAGSLYFFDQAGQARALTLR